MTRFTRVTGRIALGVLATVALGAIAAAPVGAHSGQLFTVVVTEESPGGDLYATVNAANAAVVPFGSPVSTELTAEGLELFNETGYVILSTLSPGYENVDLNLGVWDHTTGTTTSVVPLVPADLAVTLLDVYALDTTPSGRLLAFVYAEVLEGEFPLDGWYVGEIDPGTGAVSLIVELTGLTDEFIYFDSIATDPTTGVTYVLFDDNAGSTYIVELDLEAGTYSEPVEFTSLVDEFGWGYPAGADFDTAGHLWFYYRLEQGDWLLLSTVGAFGATAELVPSGSVEAVMTQNLAYDPYEAPQLADTGSDVAPLVLGGAGLLLAGATVVLIARRRTA